MQITIKLISKNKENTRANLFSKLIAESGGVLHQLGEIDEAIDELANYNIYFGSDLFEDREGDKIREMLVLRQKTTSIPIVDVSNEEYDSSEKGATLLSATLCAGIVTCNDEIIQENIYENTGRLATIIKMPLSDIDFDEPDSTLQGADKGDLNILWFGLSNEIFSIRQYQVHKNEFNLKTFIFGSPMDKFFTKTLSKADLVFLPKTFTKASEDNRITKARGCALAGKFVIAPELEDDSAFTGTLEEGLEFCLNNDMQPFIKERQINVKNKFNYQASLAQLTDVLKKAPKMIMEELDFIEEI